ncbi:hypothetical protein CLAFUW4_08792 [Fulvia fulva]|uniref:Uncharacterized protein n=1 Tax=Passalora fulva TaxID=5499 RepID=A0A9Q8UTT3_PASFU|nr:uncharacterized protein CLAFUR5_08899 [Fulvia fulva]KAK4613285.1 hypothetical protein CLAFUR4_08798 [Fulvia fulva]KAK4615076.1 hypothetical protein CLAFUR0_08790 [Fulvia fulva]UJO22148.1 hypothetical protein CLAFUR5_08899 [Fulvia fulva]WPV20073.1 hypothetical protein CLAFUW4_08792 [Fulvia fulva]WPV35451.1 hypothetical protein CLAFUW7_08793 [Fulvia fulva]
MATANLCVALYDNGVFFKHWALFVNGRSNQEKVIFHVQGAEKNFKYESRQGDATTSKKFLESLPLCRIEISKLKDIELAAENTVLHNERRVWNHQDYVLDLLDKLEEEGIVNGDDKEYRKNKDAVRCKQDGLVKI